MPVTHQDIVIEHTGIAASDFITGSWPMVSDFNFIPGYFIAVDRVFQSVVLALRGSTTHKDWLTDFCGTYDPFYVRRRHHHDSHRRRIDIRDERLNRNVSRARLSLDRLARHIEEWCIRRTS